MGTPFSFRHTYLFLCLFACGCAASRNGAPDISAMGTGSSNGGNSAVDEKTGQVNFLDLVRIPGTIVLKPSDMPAYKILKQKLAGSSAYRGCTYMPFHPEVPSTNVIDHIMLAVDSLELRLVMNGTPLPDPGDKGVVVLPSKDRKVERFALQIIKTGELWVDGQLIEKMSDNDIAAFILHEGLIRLWYFDLSNMETNRSEGHLEFGHLTTTDKIADIVNLTFSGSRFAKYLPPKSLASKFCEAGLRVAADAEPGLLRVPLPTKEVRTPALPGEVFMFLNRDCRMRHLKVTASWETKELSDVSAQELSNLPEGALDGRDQAGRFHDRPDSAFWKSWLFPELNQEDRRETNIIGPHRIPPIRFTGTIYRLPVREMYRGNAFGEGKVPHGNFNYLVGSGVESFWLVSDVNEMPDELLLGFSLWRRSDARLEFTGDGRLIRRK